MSKVERAFWLGPNVTIYEETLGTLLIGVMKGSFCSSLGETVEDGYDGYSRQKKRYGVCILNCMTTSNHVHLLVFDRGECEVIPRSMQLIAGRIVQDYNERKKRKGAFGEDRHQATTGETNQYLIQCLVYMDLNSVRAGQDVQYGKAIDYHSGQRFAAGCCQGSEAGQGFQGTYSDYTKGACSSRNAQCGSL